MKVKTKFFLLFSDSLSLLTSLKRHTSKSRPTLLGEAIEIHNSIALSTVELVWIRNYLIFYKGSIIYSFKNLGAVEKQPNVFIILALEILSCILSLGIYGEWPCWNPCCDIQTDRQIDRQTDGQTQTHTHTYIHKLRDRWMNGWMHVCM